jgi:hypothetical protein
MLYEQQKTKVHIDQIFNSTANITTLQHYNITKHYHSSLYILN